MSWSWYLFVPWTVMWVCVGGKLLLKARSDYDIITYKNTEDSE